MSDIHIHHPYNQAPADTETWDTKAMQEVFTVVGFVAGSVAVTRKSDGVQGSLEFNGMPRVYHTFRAD